MELQLDELSARELNILDDLSDSNLRSADLRSQSLVLKDEIDSIFIQRAARSTDIRARPIVAESLSSGSCHLCGASDHEVSKKIEERVSTSFCPLCGIHFPNEALAREAMESIAQLDNELSHVSGQIQEEAHRRRRTEAEIAQVQAAIGRQQRKIAEFEREHRGLAKAIGTTNVNEIHESIQANTRVIRDLNIVKSDARRDRDDAMERLKQIQSHVSQQYAGSEREFLTIFKDLAESFIGLDLDVQFDIRGTEIFLVLALEGKSRRRQYQLSESQRFFVDIALRMAIMTFMSSEATGTLLVDTPEGSLDIAYESRAGEMFARFVENEFRLLMTANINTSRLLRELAQRCGKDNMYLERMTEWTTLSAVQESAQDLFTEAFEQIEADLRHVGP